MISPRFATRLFLALLVLGAFLVLWLRPVSRTAQLERAPSAQEGLQRRDPAALEAEGSAAGSVREPVAASGSAPALRVLVRDALDGTPVAGLPIVVYQELDFGLSRELAQATTDPQGRAQFERLEGELVVVATRRRPPFARGFGAARLVWGTTSVVEIPLRGGGTVRGRVVDDAHQPVAGAEILLAGDGPPGRTAPGSARDLTQVAARSADDGRFELACIAPAPDGITLDSGALQARFWLPELVHARKDGLVASAEAHVQAFETRDLGDLVLEANNRFSGVVLDADELPVAGALVSLQSGRAYAREYRLSGSYAPLAIGPGQPGFALAEGEMLSASSGRFELQGKSEQITVWTSAGQLQSFPLPKLPPGESKADLVLRLDRKTRLEIELVDAAGERVRTESPVSAQPGLITAWRAGSPTGGLAGDFEFPTGEPLRQHIQCDPDGLWRFDLPVERGAPRALDLRLAGYLPVRATLAGRALPRLRYQVEEVPNLRVLLHATDGERIAGSFIRPLDVQVQICLADPARREQNPDAKTFHPCCGRGSSISFTWQGADRSVALLAGERRPYWVYLRGAIAGKPQDLASYGPFAVGGEEHELAISYIDLRDRMQATVPPAPVGQPLAPVARGSLLARIVDVSGSVLAGRPMLLAQSLEDSKRMPLRLYGKPGENGELRIQSVPAGAWSLRVTAPGHATRVFERVVVQAGQATDLGTIALEARAPFRARLLRADGSPVGAGCSAGAFLGPLRTIADPDAEGRFAIDADLPAEFALLVHERGLSGGNSWSTQSLRVEHWEPGEEQVLRLRPWRTFEVRVAGPAAELPESNFFLRVRPAPGAELAEDSNAYAVPFDASVEAGRRVFRLALAEGRYEIDGGGLLASIPATSIEVRASDELQSIELDSR